MNSSLFSALGMLIRLFLALALIAGLVLVVFVAYKGSQPMRIEGANGMTYWQFVSERVGVIRGLPAKCQQLHFAGFVIAVPFYPLLYTYVGLYPESYIARHTQPDTLIPKIIHWFDAPDTWWSLIEDVSWEAWVTPHLPSVMPECNLKAPVISTSRK